MTTDTNTLSKYDQGTVRFLIYANAVQAMFIGYLLHMLKVVIFGGM